MDKLKAKIQNCILTIARVQFKKKLYHYYYSYTNVKKIQVCMHMDHN